ncbi:MAG: DHA2 family efflux MFS transporter permease subunit [Chloroflexota bacterium]|nr:DHA2 family efflux MFS transporter permease subunit [Chloroflexota bacterium]
MTSTRSLFVALVAIIIGTFMVILDSTVVNVALPTLGRVLAADLGLLKWVIGAYLLAQAAVIPLSGWLSDRFGAKRVYLVSLVLFTLGSALCGLAPTAELLVAARVFQGLGGGMLMPIGMAVLYRLTPPERIGAIFGLFGLPLMVAPALGPVLSGYLLQYADWRLIFLINIPIGAIAMVFAQRVLPALPPGRLVGALDLPGAILGPLAFASLSFGISESTTSGWASRPTLGGIGVGLAALALFIWRQLTAADPVLDLRVFARRQFTLAIMTQWGAIGAMFGTFFLVPLFLQQVRGYGSFETGLYTLSHPITAAIFMQLGGRAFDRLGARWPVVFGLTMTGVAMALLSRVDGATAGAQISLALAFSGAGMGSMMMPLTSHLLGSAPRELVSRVTSLQSALQNVVASLAIASFATILQARIPLHLAEVTAAAGGQPPPAMLADAAAWAFGDVFRVGLGLAVLAWCLSWTLRRGRPPLPGPGRAGEVSESETEAAEREPVLAAS